MKRRVALLFVVESLVFAWLWSWVCLGADKPQKTKDELIQAIVDSEPDLVELVRRSKELQKSSADLEQRTSAQLAKTLKWLEECRQRDEESPYSVGNKNFVVGTVGRSFSEAILKRCDELRRDIAIKRFGKELPEGKEFAIARIEVEEDSDCGEECDVWLCGKGRAFRGANRIWITARSKERVFELLPKAIETVVTGTQVADKIENKLEK